MLHFPCTDGVRTLAIRRSDTAISFTNEENFRYIKFNKNNILFIFLDIIFAMPL